MRLVELKSDRKLLMKCTNTDWKSEKRIAPDTNILISGLLWTGPPHELICMAEEGDIQLYTSLEILNELEDVLHRDKFQNRIATLGTNVEEIRLKKGGKI